MGDFEIGIHGMLFEKLSPTSPLKSTLLENKSDMVWAGPIFGSLLISYLRKNKLLGCLIFLLVPRNYLHANTHLKNYFPGNILEN